MGRMFSVGHLSDGVVAEVRTCVIELMSISYVCSFGSRKYFPHQNSAS